MSNSWTLNLNGSKILFLVIKRCWLNSCMKKYWKSPLITIDKVSYSSRVQGKEVRNRYTISVYAFLIRNSMSIWIKASSAIGWWWPQTTSAPNITLFTSTNRGSIVVIKATIFWALSTRNSCWAMSNIFKSESRGYGVRVIELNSSNYLILEFLRVEHAVISLTPSIKFSKFGRGTKWRMIGDGNIKVVHY